MSDGLKDRVRALYAAVNAEDLATVEAVDDPELRSWAPRSDQPLGRQAALAAFRALRGAFPDFHDQGEVLLAEGDMVVARVSSRPGCAAPTGQPTPPSTWNREENVVDDGGEGLVRRYYEEALNLGRFDRLDDLLTAEFVDHEELRGIPPTRDGLKQKYTMLRAGFSDFAFTIEDLFSAEDRVAARVTVRGTHDGEFIGRPATGRSFAVTSVGIFRITDGRIAEHWGVFDQLAMLGQLGALSG